MTWHERSIHSLQFTLGMSLTIHTLFIRRNLDPVRAISLRVLIRNGKTGIYNLELIHKKQWPFNTLKVIDWGWHYFFQTLWEIRISRWSHLIKYIVINTDHPLTVLHVSVPTCPHPLPHSLQEEGTYMCTMHYLIYGQRVDTTRCNPPVHQEGLCWYVIAPGLHLICPLFVDTILFH